MNKETLRKFIESVAEIKDLKPTSCAGIRLDEQSGGEVKYNGELIEIGKHNNPTLGFKFVKLKDNHKLCELGCGDIVSNQVIERKLAQYPKSHWRTKCQTCGMYVTPDGKGFAKSTEISNIYIKYFNQQKYKELIDQGNKIVNINGEDYVETVNNDSIIRKPV